MSERNSVTRRMKTDITCETVMLENGSRAFTIKDLRYKDVLYIPRGSEHATSYVLNTLISAAIIHRFEHCVWSHVHYSQIVIICYYSKYYYYGENSLHSIIG